MALSKPTIASLEAAKHHFLQRCRKNNRMKFSLLITGKTAVGKSSLVNALVGKQVAEEMRDKTDKVIAYDVEDIEGVKVRVWDSPGLTDDDDDDEGDAGNDAECAEKIAREIREELDVVILCLKMNDKRFHRDDKDTFKILTKHFGKELWKNAVIALTFANKVEDPAEGDRKDYFKQDLENWREAIFPFLRNTLKLDLELMQSLPIVPTGYYRPFSVLPNGGNWLSELWIACDTVGRNSTPFRLKRIRKDEEQPHWFLKKAWKTFKEYCFRKITILGVFIIIFGVSQIFLNWRNNQHNKGAEMQVM